MSGWRKRTIAEMAREAGFMAFEYPALIAKKDLEKVEAFAKLVREDERERITELVDEYDGWIAKEIKENT